MPNTALEDRLAAAFDDGSKADDVKVLIKEVEAAALAADEAAKHARERALDPASKNVALARREMSDADFRRDRLQAALPKLQARQKKLLASEENAQRRIAYAKAEAVRDKLATELRETYPQLVDQLLELMTRLRANDLEVEYINANALPSGSMPLLVAELVARDLPGFARPISDIPRITKQLRLPAFVYSEFAPYAWPTAPRLAAERAA
jgi:chromosome segregation ATPase